VILDTNAVSALVDGDAAIEPRLRGASVAAIPVIALGEYRFGVAQSKKRAVYEAWLGEHLKLFRVLVIDRETAEAYSEVRLELKTAGTPIPVNDLWIAALARQHRMRILSRDRHFDAVQGVRRIAW
jgi:predicted nucleic acid-binding protein